MNEWEYNALSACGDPMVSAKALISVHQYSKIRNVDTGIQIILHKNPAEIAKALIMFGEGTSKQSKFVVHQVTALLKHQEPVKLAQTYCELIKEKITLTHAQELKIAELESHDSVVQPLIALTAIQSRFPSGISAEIKDAIIVHQSPAELVEAIQLIHDNDVDMSDAQRYLLLYSDEPKILAASYASLKKLALEPDDFLSVVSHPEFVELISELSALSSAGVQLTSPELKKIIAHEYFKDVSEAIIHLKTHAPDLMLDSRNIQMIIDHPRPKFVLATLKSLAKINKTIDQDKLNKIEADSFANWRSDITPSFEMQRPAIPDEWTHDPLKQEVIRQAQEEYKKSIHLMERSVAEVSLGYVRKLDRIPDPFPMGKLASAEAGPLLQFANVYSARYLDLYKAYVSIEKKKGIPMIPVSAGQLKLHGFTSEDILQMQPECKVFTSLVATLKTALEKEGSKAYVSIVTIMVGRDKLTRKEAIKLSKAELETRTGIKLSDQQHHDIITVFKTYDELPEKGTSLIGKAHFLMHDFGHLSYDNIANQLAYVGDIEPQHLKKTTASPDERLLMEIRHRVAGDGTIQQNSPGTLGGNPLTYLNVLTKGEPDNPEAEFRNKMFFVYMSNHFANAVIENDEIVGEINQWLRENGKGWELDMDFITTMRQRGAQYMPPIFRYGANAALNREFREIKSDEAVSEFYSTHPNISLREVMEGSAHHNAFHRGKLSSREYLNQIGELEYSPNDPRNERQLNFGTGAAIFELKESPNSNMSQATQTYLNSVNELGIPVCAGISGTLDQSTAMAGLVGLGVNEALGLRQLELETIRLAYLGFMLPGGDHTVHEIMQSSKTYGLPYVGGIGYEAYIYPPDDAYIKGQLRNLQQMRGSDEHLHTLLHDLEQRVSLSQVELKKFHERLDEATLNPVHTELLKKLFLDEYQTILTYFSDDTNTRLMTKLSLLENGQSCRFAKEETGLPRTIHVIRSQDGEYKLLVEKKRKLAEGIDIDRAFNLNKDVVSSMDGCYFDKMEDQRYYIGVSLKKAPSSDDAQDSREKLGDDIAHYLKGLPNQDIQLIDRDQWHITVGWLENTGSENTPISNEDYKLIEPKIAPIIEKYAQLEFELLGFGPNYSKKAALAHLIEKTGQLELLHNEIKEMVRLVAPGVEFKFFAMPHIEVAWSKVSIQEEALPHVTAVETYQISNIDMMYHDDKKHKNVMVEQYSTKLAPVLQQSTEGSPSSALQHYRGRLFAVKSVRAESGVSVSPGASLIKPD